jgi:hypothetical protein
VAPNIEAQAVHIRELAVCDSETLTQAINIERASAGMSYIEKWLLNIEGSNSDFAQTDRSAIFRITSYVAFPELLRHLPIPLVPQETPVQDDL